MQRFFPDRQTRLKFWFSLKKRLKIDDGNTVSLERIPTGKGKIKVHGKGNSITIRRSGAPQDKLQLNLRIYGDGNVVEIGEGVISAQCTINIGTKEYPCRGASVLIGEKTQLNGVNFQVAEDYSKISVGSRCLFSWGIEVWASDTHTITDASGAVKNRGTAVDIGNKVWIGMDVKIGKNTKLGDGCIVGWGSIVTKQFPENNCIIAGNPARIVKRNVSWLHRPPHLGVRENETETERT